MKIKEYLREEFRTGVKQGGTYYEIYSNPFKYDDFKSLPNKVRFCLNLDTNKLLIWDAELLHTYVADELNLEYGAMTYKKHIIWGEASLNEKKLKFEYSHSLADLSNKARSDLQNRKTFEELIKKAEKSSLVKSIEGLPEEIKKVEKTVLG